MVGVTGDLWRDLLSEAWAALAIDGRVAAGPMPVGIEVDGSAGHLVSRLAVEDTAIACIGAAMLAAAGLHEQRGGRKPGPVRLATGHVAAAVRSEAYLRRRGEPFGPGFAPLSRFWRASDGWVRTHANYLWHREALLRALGAAADDAAAAYDAVVAAIGSAPAREIEARVFDAGGVAAAVRSAGDWRTHPQGQAVADQRLVEGGPIGEAPPRRRPACPLPASGVRVLDLTRVIAGPVATRFLAALGADVLRLDPPQLPELPLHARDGLLGKRSALLDARTRDGLTRLHELLDETDVLVHGYRPHALSRFGIDSATGAERHPGVVMASMSAWGTVGPWGVRRGFDSIVQAACGIAMAESADGERPGAMPCQLLDHGTGYLCAAAVLGALRLQADTGGTHARELSLARTAWWLLSQRRGDTTPAAPGDDGLVAAWLTTVDSDEGPVTTVTPPGQFGGHGLDWPRSLTSYGGDPARW